VGDEVFGHLAYSPFTKQGSFAEYVVVEPDRVGRKPPDVTHEQAAAAATTGCTALQALRDRGRLRAGGRVLVNGASGGVGSYAVQIAQLLGAEAWGTASAAKANFVRGLGATEVLDYRQTPIEEIDETFDVVFDAAATSSFGRTKHLLARGGAYVTTLPSLRFFGGVLASLLSSRRCSYVTVQSKSADLEQLGSWIASGELDPSLEETYPFQEVTTALAALESGRVRGKVALQIG
jgi:NADPH:quinone reductase-like Zn-dependent oxidoreductase